MIIIAGEGSSSCPGRDLPYPPTAQGYPDSQRHEALELRISGCGAVCFKDGGDRNAFHCAHFSATDESVYYD